MAIGRAEDREHTHHRRSRKNHHGLLECYVHIWRNKDNQQQCQQLSGTDTVTASYGQMSNGDCFRMVFWAEIDPARACVADVQNQPGRSP